MSIATISIKRFDVKNINAVAHTIAVSEDFMTFKGKFIRITSGVCQGGNVSITRVFLTRKNHTDRGYHLSSSIHGNEKVHFSLS